MSIAGGIHTELLNDLQKIRYYRYSYIYIPSYALDTMYLYYILCILYASQQRLPIGTSQDVLTAMHSLRPANHNKNISVYVISLFFMTTEKIYFTITHLLAIQSVCNKPCLLPSKVLFSNRYTSYTCSGILQEPVLCSLLAKYIYSYEDVTYKEKGLQGCLFC